ncbi:MAG: hypothetical protein D3904_17970, partial [Candidatus Electrothrix sp. EH2]|nr:hypothetical protein [Candidatus Electrothrix sp. EH2]
LKFNREQLPGAWFGRVGDLEVPLFQYVRSQRVKASASPEYQIDVLGMEAGQEYRVWLCECKYTRKPMGIGQVEKLEAAAQVFQQQMEEEQQSVPEIRLWLISTGGFTQEVLKYAGNREDMYASDYEGINNIFRRFGSNYSIPLFVSNERPETEELRPDA